MLNITTTKKGSTLTVCLEGKLDRNTSDPAYDSSRREDGRMLCKIDESG